MEVIDFIEAPDAQREDISTAKQSVNLMRQVPKGVQRIAKEMHQDSQNLTKEAEVHVEWCRILKGSHLEENVIEIHSPLRKDRLLRHKAKQILLRAAPAHLGAQKLLQETGNIAQSVEEGVAFQRRAEAPEEDDDSVQEPKWRIRLRTQLTYASEEITDFWKQKEHIRKQTFIGEDIDI